MSTPKATRREWIGLVVIALPCLLYSMDLTVLNLAVPSLTAELAPSSTQLLWIVDVYGFLVAGSLITMGTLGDRIGRRRLLLIGAAAFGVASILAAFSNSAEMLIATRAILGIAGATLAPSTMSLIRNMFLDARERSFAIGVWVASFSTGGVIGPLVGGLLLEHFWWGSVFLVGVPVMVMLLVLGPLLLPEYRDPNAGKPDLLSAFLSLGAVLGVIYGLKEIAAHGPRVVPAASIALGVALGIIFVRRQRTLADPLIDLRLFETRAFTASLLIYIFSNFAFFGAYVFLAQYLQLVLGLSPMTAGWWSVPLALGFTVGSMIAPVFSRRISHSRLMACGAAFSALGFFALTRVSGEADGWLIIASTLALSLGLSPVVTLANDLIIGVAPPERAGAASAISETGAELGGALGIAVLGSVGTAIYRSAMVGSIPASVPQPAADAARDTLAGALAAAADMPASAELLSAAKEAFTRGFHITTLIGGVIVAGIAVLVLVPARRR